MKKMNLFLALFVCLTAAHAKERVVERPFYAATTTTTLEIRKIALSDTATVFFIDAYYAPNQWIKIAEESYLAADDGQEYPVRSSAGIALGKEFYMPESGTASFQLVFPPLPASVKEVGFTEGDFEGSFQLWGIRLDGKPVAKAAATGKKSKEAPFLETPEIKQGNAVFSGKLLHYPAQMRAKVTAWKYDHLMNGGEEINIPVDDDGTFRVEIPLCYPTMIGCSSPLFSPSVFLTPGEETSIVINLPELTRAKSRLLKETPSLGESYAFSGKNAALNDEINSHPQWRVKPFIQSEKDYTKVLSDIAGMSGEEFKAYWMERYAAGLREIEGFTGISETYRKLQEQNLRLDIAGRLFSPAGFLEYAYRRTHGLENDAPLPDEAKVEITEEYYSFVKDLVPNDPFGLYANYYGRMVQTLSMLEGQQFPSIAALYGTDRGILFDLIALQRLAQPITEFKPLPDDELAKARAISPVFANLLTEKNDELKVKIEANKKKTGYTAHPSDDTKNIPNEELFAAVTQAHRGKVVFVDFWATWCGPCLQAMKTSEEAKKEMEEKGVIFLYLTGETSPMGTWQNMIPDIKGEHYRVTAGQWDYWSKSFGIRGIPFYLILGKQGDIAFTSLGFMGVDKMREVLNTELEKPE
ncbi:MAG: redoxin family protein [Tannerellaceae bacterium]|jgi:thiol-disulfide isomerase/thioredoxin|nr:redoxin family protein [Tannerellaceae bacterium]